MRLRTVYTADHPWRGETYEDGRRIWAEATSPDETLNDVLAHIGAQLTAGGAPPDAFVRVKHTGCPPAEPVPVSLLGTGTPWAAPVLQGEAALDAAIETIARRFYRAEYQADDLTSMKSDIREAVMLAVAAGVGAAP